MGINVDMVSLLFQHIIFIDHCASYMSKRAPYLWYISEHNSKWADICLFSLTIHLLNFWKTIKYVSNSGCDSWIIDVERALENKMNEEQWLLFATFKRELNAAPNLNPVHFNRSVSAFLKSPIKIAPSIRLTSSQVICIFA